MRFGGRSLALCPRDVAQKHPADVLHHAAVTLDLILVLHLCNSFISYSFEVRKEEIDMGMEKVNLE